jgi:hypothetical protein
MPETRTANYPLTQPEVGASQDTWGNRLNEDLVILDRLLFNRIVKNATNEDIAAAAHQVMTLHLDLPAQVDGQAAGTAGGEIRYLSAATARWVETRAVALMNQFIPHGMIIMWHGNFTDVPAGWVICNGLNGTPDLRDRVVLAAGQTGTYDHEPNYAYGATGHGLGTHKHQQTAWIAAGPAGNPEFANDYDGNAFYRVNNPHGVGDQSQGHIPYYCLVYIMKYGNWVA